MNPYQQNIDIIKGFFKRKLILFYAIVTILPIFSLVFIDVNDLMTSVGGLNGGNFLNNVPQNTNVAGSFASMYFMFIFEILLAVAFLLFFVKAGTEESSLKAPIGMFRVVSVIKLVVVVLIALASVLVVMLTSLHIMANYAFWISILTVPFMFLAIPVFLLLIVSQTIFAGNIKESVNSIYLKKKGAKLFGVMNIIAAMLIVYFSVIVAVFALSNNSENSLNMSFVPFIVFFSLTVVKYIVSATVGLKYTKYIEGFADSATTRENEEKTNEINNTPEIIICKKCGKPLTKDDYFCNHCGTPVDK